MTYSECARYKTFRSFLNGITKTTENDETQRERTIVARVSNDSYPVSVGEEMQAEIRTAIWNHLQGKRYPCPPLFDIALLRAAVDAVTKECFKAGGVPQECQCVVGNKGTNDETSITEVQYDLVKLQKFVVNVLEQLLTRLADNSEADNLKSFYLEVVGSLCESGKCCCDTNEGTAKDWQTPVIWSYASYIKNKPRKMEDRHFCLDRYSEMYNLKTPCSLYGVLDGHSGTLAASYAASQLPYLLAERLRNISNPSDCGQSIFCDAFESAFLQADRMFCNKRISSGTTAVVVLVMQNAPALFVAWVGDSKALLVSPTVSLQLVKPHKPDSPDERKRISETGGSVLLIQGHWRVNGILNVARSIGDYSVNAVIAEPDVVDVKLQGHHDFLILGTDGLWDHVDEGAIVQVVYQALTDAEQKAEDIPKLLVDMAKKGDSQDNITVVIVLLKERHLIVENYKKS